MDNLLQQLQEQYLAEFSNQVSLKDFLVNVLVIALLSALLRLFYISYGNSVSNRRDFANNFLPLALGTLLIIMIVKSSIALSLGLVGALSIVRFRAAIKEPEELTYLFLVIGLGLAGGANQPVLAIVAFIVIIGILWVGKLLARAPINDIQQHLYIHLTTSVSDLTAISALITGLLPHVELKRMDTRRDADGLQLSYRCRASQLDQLDTLRQQLRHIDPDCHISVIDEPKLLI